MKNVGNRKWCAGWPVLVLLALVMGALATGAASKPAVKEAEKTDVPPAFAVSKVKEALARLQELLRGSNINISPSGNAIVLSGTVPTAVQVRLIMQAAQQGASGYRIVNRLRVKSPGSSAPGTGTHEARGTQPQDSSVTTVINGQTQPAPQPTPVPKSFIEGHVLDARDKTPVANAEIWVEDQQTDSFGEALTDASGHFRIAVEPGDDFYLLAKGPQHSRRVYNGLQVGHSGLRQDVLLVRRPVVKGIVHNATGRPLSGATLYFNSQDQQLNTQDQVVSDRNGTFRSQELDVPDSGHARYEVAVVHPRFSSIEKKFEARARYTASDEVSLDFKLSALATVTGRITHAGKPFKGAYFAVVTSDGLVPLDNALSDSNRPAPTTDANGRFRLSLDAPASYIIRVYGEDTLDSEIKISLRPGQNLNFNRDLKPFPYGTIAGRVLDLSGRPVRNAAIELWTPRTSETSPVAYTDRNGYYRASKVAPVDDYRVVAYMPQSQMRTGPARERVRVRSHRTTIVNLRGDTIPPRLRILSPASGAAATGMVMVRVRARDNDGVSAAVLRLDDDWLGDVEVSPSDADHRQASKSPITQRVRRRDVVLRWDSRKVPNGRYSLLVEVYDIDGNMASGKVNLWVANPPRSNLNAPRLPPSGSAAARSSEKAGR